MCFSQFSESDSAMDYGLPGSGTYGAEPPDGPKQTQAQAQAARLQCARLWLSDTTSLQPDASLGHIWTQTLVLFSYY